MCKLQVMGVICHSNVTCSTLILLTCHITLFLFLYCCINYVKSKTVTKHWLYHCIILRNYTQNDITISFQITKISTSLVWGLARFYRDFSVDSTGGNTPGQTCNIGICSRACSLSQHCQRRWFVISSPRFFSWMLYAKLSSASAYHRDSCSHCFVTAIIMLYDAAIHCFVNFYRLLT